MKKKIALLLALCMCFCMFAACSGNEAKETPSTASDVILPSNAPESKEPEIEMSDLEMIQDKGEMIIGYTVYAPMNYTDENGEFTGFDTELATAICEQLGVTPVFQEINWDTKEIELAAGTIDCIWNGLTIDEDRKAAMEITDPYVLNAQAVVMLADNDYTDTSSLIGFDICAEQTSAGDTTIQNDENLSQANFVGKTVQTDCLMEVAAGTCKAAVLDITLANAMIGEGTSYSNLVIVDTLGEEFYGVAFRKGSDACAATNDIFTAMKADGSMKEIADKYELTLAE